MNEEEGDSVRSSQEVHHFEFKGIEAVFDYNTDYEYTDKKLCLLDIKMKLLETPTQRIHYFKMSQSTTAPGYDDERRNRYY